MCTCILSRGIGLDISLLERELIESCFMETDKLKLLTKAMTAYKYRSQALASNIANLDTPGYQRLSVSFEDQLRETRHQVPGLRGIDDVNADMEVEEEPPILEDELMALTDTQMRTQFASRALRDHFARISQGITGNVG